MIRSASTVALALAPALAAGETHFFDGSSTFGAEFQHASGPTTFGMGAGVAWLDCDGDGDEDLLCTSGDGAHRLLRRDAAGFVDVTPGGGLAPLQVPDNIGVAVADFDQDGLPDVYLTNRGANVLGRNHGDGSFEDVTDAVGVGSPGWSTSASWADFDLDGDLDLYVGNYVGEIQFPYHVGEPNDLYLNEGTAEGPAFVERGAELGVDGMGVYGRPDVPPELVRTVGTPQLGAPTAGCTLSTCTVDYDEDGDADLMVGNDFGMWVLPDVCYRNDGEPGGALAFTDVTLAVNFDLRPAYNMGINAADYDHDGDWDLYLSNLGDNVLMRNDGGVFSDATYTAGPVDGVVDGGDLLLTSWGTVWADFDNDGWEDLFVVNGHIPAASFIDNATESPNNLWLNRGDGTFERVDPTLSGLADLGAARGMAASDVDGDGWMDLYVMNNGHASIAHPGDRCRLFVNRGKLGDPGNHWLSLRLIGTSSNVEGLGARVEALTPTALRKRQVLGDPVYISAGTRRVHFGLGAERRVDVLTVHWPSGIVQELLDVPADEHREVREPSVLVRGLEGPLEHADGVVVGVALENVARRPLDFRLRVELRPGAPGRAASALASGRLAGGERRVQQVVVALDAGQRAALAAEPHELRATALAARTSDAERVALR